MKVQSTYRGRTYKEVTIEHDFDAEPVSPATLVRFAMEAVGETRESLFGTRVERFAQYPHMAVVTLNTD